MLLCLGSFLAVASADALEVDVAGCEITPDVMGHKVPLAGYGARQGRPATGVHDPLHAKALLFRDRGVVFATVDAELIRLTRLRSARAEEQYRIRTNLRRSHEDSETFTMRLGNLRQDITTRQDTSADNFRIELDGQTLDNRGIAGELIVRRAEKLKNRFGDDVRIGRFAGFDLFLRPSFNDTVEVVVRGKNSYGARVTDTALGTIRSLEATVQGFEERAAKLETDIADSQKRATELETKVGAPFEKEERYQQLSRRQSEIEEKLDLTKNQAPSQAEADSPDDTSQNNSKTQMLPKTFAKSSAPPTRSPKGSAEASRSSARADSAN